MPSKYGTRKARIEEAEERLVSARELSRRELYAYLFGGAIRGFYILGCLFLDSMIPVLVLNFIYSDTFGMGVFRPVSVSTGILAMYLAVLLALVETALVYLQIKFGLSRLRRFGKGFQKKL